VRETSVQGSDGFDLRVPLVIGGNEVTHLKQLVIALTFFIKKRNVYIVYKKTNGARNEKAETLD